MCIHKLPPFHIHLTDSPHSTVFQYLFTFHLFYSEIHGFSTVVLCCHIKSPIVMIAVFDKVFVLYCVTIALKFYLCFDQIRMQQSCFQNVGQNFSKWHDQKVVFKLYNRALPLKLIPVILIEL